MPLENMHVISCKESEILFWQAVSFLVDDLEPLEATCEVSEGRSKGDLLGDLAAVMLKGGV